MAVITAILGNNLKQVWGHHLLVRVWYLRVSSQQGPAQDLLNSLVREGAMAVAVFRSMALEIPSGPDDVFLGMEDSRWRTSSLEQEMFESSGGGGFGSGGLYVRILHAFRSYIIHYLALFFLDRISVPLFTESQCVASDMSGLIWWQEAIPEEVWADVVLALLLQATVLICMGIYWIVSMHGVCTM